MALDPALYAGLASIRHALRQFVAFSDAETRTEGITAQQYQAMLILKMREGGDRLATRHPAEWLRREPLLAASLQRLRDVAESG